MDFSPEAIPNQIVACCGSHGDTPCLSSGFSYPPGVCLDFSPPRQLVGFLTPSLLCGFLLPCQFHRFLCAGIYPDFSGLSAGLDVRDVKKVLASLTKIEFPGLMRHTSSP